MRSAKTTIQNLNAVVRIVCTTNYNAELLHYCRSCDLTRASRSMVDDKKDADFRIWPKVTSCDENAGNTARSCDKVGSEGCFCYTRLIPL